MAAASYGMPSPTTGTAVTAGQIPGATHGQQAALAAAHSAALAQQQQPTGATGVMAVPYGHSAAAAAAAAAVQQFQVNGGQPTTLAL